MSTLKSAIYKIRPAFAAVLSCGAVLVAALVVCARLASAAPLPEKTVPQSCGMQLKANNCRPETLDEIRGLGFRAVRRGFIWESIEKKKGVYDFSAYDPLLADARKRGLRVLGCIAFGNKLYGSVREPEGRQAYARFAAALAERYKDHNILWEIWNEPNTMTFWGKHGKKGNTPEYAAEYVALVKEAVPAMHRADPKCFVLGGSVSCLWSESFTWIDSCFKDGIMASGINGWSVHPYGFKSPEEHVAGYAKTRQIMAQYGVPADFPMLNTERGFSVKENKKNAEGWAGGPAGDAYQHQAWHLVRQYLIDLLCDVRLTIWYEWGGDEFGLSGGKEPRPAHQAAKVMIEQLDGYRLVKRLPTASAADFALLFEKEKGPGRQKLVVWTSPPKANQTPDKTVAHAVDIAVGVSGSLDVYDLAGKKSAVVAKGGKISVQLSGSPQYITLRK